MPYFIVDTKTLIQHKGKFPRETVIENLISATNDEFLFYCNALYNIATLVVACENKPEDSEKYGIAWKEVRYLKGAWVELRRKRDASR